MKISNHFDDSEFACPCCGQVKVSPELVQKLEQLRSKLGKPIIITSGYRCSNHNKEVGGVPNSFHTQGMAADFKVPGMTPDEILDFIEKVLPDIAESCGIGSYSSWVHLDSRGYRARWSK